MTVSAPAVTWFAAPHRNQTVALRVTDELIADLKEADSVETMLPYYRPRYEAGVFGNKHLIEQLEALRAEGVEFVEGKLVDHVDAEERIDVSSRRVMVISSEQEDCLVWAGPWEGERPRGTTLRPTDVVLDVVELADPA